MTSGQLPQLFVLVHSISLQESQRPGGSPADLAAQQLGDGAPVRWLRRRLQEPGHRDGAAADVALERGTSAPHVVGQRERRVALLAHQDRFGMVPTTWRLRLFSGRGLRG